MDKEKRGIITKAQQSRYSAWQRGVHNLPKIPNEAFFTAEEIANNLKVNIMTIYRYIKAKRLKAYKIGKQYRIEKNKFEEFLNKECSK